MLVLACVVIHYETLRLLDWAVQRLKRLERLRIVLIVLGCFCAHVVEVTVFAAGLYVSAIPMALGVLKGALDGDFSDYLYLSMSSYTSLGIGDIYAVGHMRLLIPVEALVGLTLIAWSATFTFLEMKTLWEDGDKRVRRKP